MSEKRDPERVVREIKRKTRRLPLSLQNPYTAQADPSCGAKRLAVWLPSSLTVLLQFAAQQRVKLHRKPCRGSCAGSERPERSEQQPP